MKNKWKRLLALLLVVTMTVSVMGGLSFAGFATSADAEDTETDSSGVTWEQIDADDVDLDLIQSQMPVESSDVGDTYEDDDTVRALIVLEDEPAAAAADPDEPMMTSIAVETQQESLEKAQERLAETISDEVLDGEELDVVWNLTLLTNAMSVSVPYGKLSEIESLDGVAKVYIETEYEPLADSTDNIIAQTMTGVSEVKETGYSGTGTRIAVIDTGAQIYHQSFSEDGLEYAYYTEAVAEGESLAEYEEGINLLTEEDIEDVMDRLNVTTRLEGVTAEDLYYSSKIPFMYNYVDNDLDVTHDNDTQGEHGSHVAGIAVANSYIESEDISAMDYNSDDALNQMDAQYAMDYVVGLEDAIDEEEADLDQSGAVSSYDVYQMLIPISYYEETGEYMTSAAEAVSVTGVAPNAQLLAMKVFGKDGGAYSSDYIAAAEDAVLLGCDVINLSLGSACGFSNSLYNLEDQDLVDMLETIVTSDTVISVSCGNDGTWASNDTAYGLTYADEAGTANVAAPSTYHSSLSVASIENAGMIGYNFVANGVSVIYTEGSSGTCNEPFTSLDTEGDGTEYQYVMFPEGVYAEEGDFDGYDVQGKIVFVQRGGGVSFADKSTRAVEAGAIGVVIYNNDTGTISMSLSGYDYTAPSVSILLSEAQEIMDVSELQEDGTYTGTITVYSEITTNYSDPDAGPELSNFSSWGTSGSLTIKPEVAAPGGSIYSVNGIGDGTAYESMSGTSMSAPHVSGVLALVSQYIQENDLVETAREVTGNSTLTRRALAQALVMSTAVPMIENDNVEYSVRGQGAGLVDAAAATQAKTLVMTDDTDGKVKAELGDDPDGEGWSFAFTLYNLSDEPLTYNLKSSIITTDVVYEDGYALASDSMRELAADVSYSTGSEVTVAAGESATVTVTIKVSAGTAARRIEEGFTNGFYVEGYIYAASNDDVTYSIPLLGWYGDWAAHSMYDNVDYTDWIYSLVEFSDLDEDGNIIDPDVAAKVAPYQAKLKASHMFDPYYWYGFTYTADQTLFSNNYTNSLAIEYGDDDEYYYYYSGNIYEQLYGGYQDDLQSIVLIHEGDSRYLEERNALNTTTNAVYDVYDFMPALINNAADLAVVVYNADDPTDVYYLTDYNTAVTTGYYYSSLACWLTPADEVYGADYYTGESGIQWYYTDADGNPLEEGDSFVVSLLAANEYEVAKNGGSMDEDAWKSLIGTGAEKSYQFAVDNTAPWLSEADDAITLDPDTDTLTIKVQDNRYVAAVILCDGTLTQTYDYYYPDMDVDQIGEEVSLTIDVSGFRQYYGNKATIAICDYAGNEAFYSVNLGGEGASYGTFVGIEYDGYGNYNWVSFNREVNMNETMVFTSELAVNCAECVDGYVFGEDENGRFYGFLYSDMLANSFTLTSHRLTTLDNIYQDLAYDYSRSELFGLVADETGDEVITSVWEINLDTYEETKVYECSQLSLGLACDDDGTLYIMYCDPSKQSELIEDSSVVQGNGEPACLMTLTIDANGNAARTELGCTGVTMDYLQSMTWNHNSEQLYWARFDAVGSFATITEVYEFTMDKENNSFAMEATGTLSGELFAMFAPLTDESAALEVHNIYGKFDPTEAARPELDKNTLTLNLGMSETLNYSLFPFYSESTDMVWSSSDETVATVDETGTVTGVSVGTCTITVANEKDETKYDTCEVTVTSLSVEIKGTISEQLGGTGNVDSSKLYTYTINGDTAEMTYTDLNWDDLVVDQYGVQDPYDENATFGNYGSYLSCALYARDKIWACEWDNTGMIFNIDPETEKLTNTWQPMDGDVMFHMTYSDNTDQFTMAMNCELYVDLDMTNAMYEEMFNSYSTKTYEFEFHRLNVYNILHSVGTWNTQEDGASQIDIAGMTSIDDAGAQNLTVDYQDNTLSGTVAYTPDTTLVIMDNVGRFWYIDEVKNMTLSGGTYVNGDNVIAADTPGVLTLSYSDGTYSVFVVRSVEETPVTYLFREGLGMTYHFTQLYTTFTSDTNERVYLMSIYDYFGNASTNEYYLYMPATDDHGEVFMSLGDSGTNQIIATIYSATVSGVSTSSQDAEDASLGNATTQSFIGRYGS